MFETILFFVCKLLSVYKRDCRIADYHMIVRIASFCHARLSQDVFDFIVVIVGSKELVVVTATNNNFCFDHRMNLVYIAPALFRRKAKHEPRCNGATRLFIFDISLFFVLFCELTALS
jgi:hypothetical protein